MSLSNPINPPIVNEAVAKPSSAVAAFGISENETKVNQLHGIAPNNANGAGIPKQVSNAQVSVANANQGTTCTVAVLYKADPTDSSLSGVNIWVKGYQGNSNPVLVGSGTSSPTKIVLNNTGETVTFIIQAFGNGGNAPFNQAPTCSGSLPKSTSGGFGTSSVLTSPLATLTMPAEFSVAQVGGAITVTKATEAANSFWAGPTSGAAAQPAFRTIDRVDLQQARQVWSYGARYHGNGTNTTAVTTFGGNSATFATSAFTSARVAATANDNPLLTAGMSTVASLNCFGMELDGGSPNSGVVRGTLQRYSCRVRHDQTTNCRFWVGLVASGSGPAGVATGLATDTPNFAVAAFRYSSTTDSVYKAVLATSSANLTATSTGVSVDTSKTKLFEVTYDGTNWNFWIDGALVVTTNTNTPANTTLLNGIYSADNKNSTNNATASFNWMLVSHS